MHSSMLPNPENSACVHVSGADQLLETVNRSKVTLNNECLPYILKTVWIFPNDGMFSIEHAWGQLEQIT